MVLLRALLAWLALLPLAVANGALREQVLAPWLGARSALATSGVLLALAVLLVAAATARWIAAPGRAWAIGGFWLALTLAFESGFGVLVQHKPWQELLHAYTFADGNLWPIVLLVILLAPPLAQLTFLKPERAARS